VPKVTRAPDLRPRPRPAQTDEPDEGIVLPSYVVPLIAAVLILAAIIALPKILGKRVETSSSASASPASESAARPAGQPVRQETARSAKQNSSSENRDLAKAAAEKSSAKSQSVAPAASPAPAALRTEAKTPANKPKGSSAGSSHGEVLDQVLPDVSDKALSTIHGIVRVGVRLHVDAAGNVSSAELDNPGPSSFFADLALKASRKWEFAPPEGTGRSVPSEWQVRFEFSPSGVKAFPSQTAP